MFLFENLPTCSVCNLQMFLKYFSSKKSTHQQLWETGHHIHGVILATDTGKICQMTLRLNPQYNRTVARYSQFTTRLRRTWMSQNRRLRWILPHSFFFRFIHYLKFRTSYADIKCKMFKNPHLSIEFSSVMPNANCLNGLCRFVLYASSSSDNFLHNEET